MIKSIESRMQKSIRALKEELATIRTGRANTSILDHVTVSYYGADVPINQVANLSVPEPRMILITPWEKATVPAIEKAILASDLGLTPSSDGDVVRIVLPELTEERRREYVRHARQVAEKARVSIRNIRRDANDDVKRRMKEREISEDEGNHLQEEIQKTTDHFIAEVDEILEHKEKDILTI